MSSETPPLVTYDKVSFRLAGRSLVDNISLQVLRGERLLIVGPNGAGKSTLLRLGHGLLHATEGRIGRSLARQRQSFMFQRPVMLRRSVLGNLAISLEAQGMSAKAARLLAEESLARQGMSHLAMQPARGLSGGEQQRLALMRATLTKPELLWLDEPTASLDPAASKDIEEQLLAINQQGTSMVIVAHDLAQARRLAHRIALIHQGRLIEWGPAPAFFQNPQTQLGRQFLDGEHLA